MKEISTDKMPNSNGHYAQCLEHQGMLYLSGQLPIDPQTREIPSTIKEQTDLVFNNVELILKEAGSSKSKVLQVRIYISDISLWDIVNKQYALFFCEHKPVRSIIPTRELHFGSLIEVEITAVI